jgi:hypothetical protein
MAFSSALSRAEGSDRDDSAEGAAMTHVSTPLWCHRLSWVATTLLLAAPAAWAQGQGLTFDEQALFGPRLQVRLGLNTSAALTDGSAISWQQQAGVLLGDYYFSRARLGQGQVSSGFRATSGVLLGQRSLALGTPALPGSQGMARQPLVALPGTESASEAWAAVPYIGVGWSGVSVRGGWGVSADLGIAGRSSGSGGLRVNGNQSLDDLLRELRIAPMVQLGVSYAF